MAQTVIGFFDDHADALHAMERLESIGIPRKNITVSRTPAKGAGTVSNNKDEDRGEHKGGLRQFFDSLFSNDSDAAARYSRVGNSGCSLVTVQAQSREQAERAADMLDECGAINVDEKASQMDYANTHDENRASRQDRGNVHEQFIPRIQENIEVSKQTVEQGGVRVRSRIIERPVEQYVRLRQEKIHVERQPVDRPVSEAELHSFREGEMEFTERAEVPVVNKEARVVEEVRIRKDLAERDTTIRDTVRNTEVDVDRVNPNVNHQDYAGRDTNRPRNL
ncbi:MAG TPA: YsnF/AvaK domain-containing protein [Flavisolibacter sp.]|nr:YsnF/AvaK domain-containing protein [Flavisolibacter sp.]